MAVGYVAFYDDRPAEFSRSLGQWRARVGRSVVVERLVPDRQALARLVRDGRFGVLHVERLEDACADDLGIRPAIQLLERGAEDLEAEVRIGIVLPGRVSGRDVARHDHLVERR